MSVLVDSRGKLLNLIQAAEQAQTAYDHAKAMIEALEAGQDVDMNGVGMNLVFEGNASIPIPLPNDREAVLDHLERAGNFLGAEIVRIWNEIYAVAAVAKQHCDQAAATAQAGADPADTQATVVQQPAQPPAAGGTLQTTPVT